MNIAVLLAGVADPKSRLAGFSHSLRKTRADNHIALSPFDEAAIEVALKIRDGRRDTKISVLMVGGPESDALIRKAAAYRLDALARVEIESLAPWDAKAMAASLASVVSSVDAPFDLVLIGREFGDYDDGGVAPCLAAAMGWPFFGLAQLAEWEGETLALVRDRRAREEKLRASQAVVASVTNDRRNRLRHPLMKNVMEAKRVSIPVIIPASLCPRVVLQSIANANPPTREIGCRVLAGPIERQTAELAAFLEPWRVGK